MPKEKTVTVKYEGRLTETCRNALRDKAESEYRSQNTVVREILENWARSKK